MNLQGKGVEVHYHNFQFFLHSLGIKIRKMYASLHYVTEDSDTILLGEEKC